LPGRRLPDRRARVPGRDLRRRTRRRRRPDPLEAHSRGAWPHRILSPAGGILAVREPGPESGDAVPEAGWVSGELRDELPGLGLRYLMIDARTSKSPPQVRARLRALSDRFAGAQAINLRHQAIPWAYRVFFRHIGLDPDEQPTPVEQLALERMFHGGFVSRNL